MSRLFFATLSFMSRLPVPQRWSQGWIWTATSAA